MYASVGSQASSDQTQTRNFRTILLEVDVLACLLLGAFLYSTAGAKLSGPPSPCHNCTASSEPVLASAVEDSQGATSFPVDTSSRYCTSASSLRPRIAPSSRHVDVHSCCHTAPTSHIHHCTESRFEAERGVQIARQTPLYPSLSPSRHSQSRFVPLVSATRRQSTPFEATSRVPPAWRGSIEPPWLVHPHCIFTMTTSRSEFPQFRELPAAIAHDPEQPVSTCRLLDRFREAICVSTHFGYLRRDHILPSVDFQPLCVRSCPLVSLHFFPVELRHLKAFAQISE